MVVAPGSARRQSSSACPQVVAFFRTSILWLRVAGPAKQVNNFSLPRPLKQFFFKSFFLCPRFVAASVLGKFHFSLALALALLAPVRGRGEKKKVHLINLFVRSRFLSPSREGEQKSTAAAAAQIIYKFQFAIFAHTLIINKQQATTWKYCSVFQSQCQAAARLPEERYFSRQIFNQPASQPTTCSKSGRTNEKECLYLTLPHLTSLRLHFSSVHFTSL